MSLTHERLASELVDVEPTPHKLSLVASSSIGSDLPSLQDLDGTIYGANPESFGVGLDAVVVDSETAVENWGEGSTPLEDDTQLAYDWQPLLPAAAGFGTSSAAAFVSAAAAGATGTAAANLPPPIHILNLLLTHLHNFTQHGSIYVALLYIYMCHI